MIYLKPTEFLGKIIIQESIVAIKETKKDISDLILWLDGLKGEVKKVSIAVVWKSFLSYRWNICKYLWGKIKRY